MSATESHVPPGRDPGGDFLTPGGLAQARITVRGSRFLAICEPCRRREQASERIREYERRYHDATHVCWAWRLRSETEPGEAWSDAGEPAGTAGVPIVGALRSAGLENALGIVVRWFGGTKLGRGGLIKAYREAMQEAVEQVAVVTEMPRVEIVCEAPAAMIGELHRLLTGTGAEYLDQSATRDRVGITVSLPVRLVDTLEEQLIAATRGEGALIRPADHTGGESTDGE